MFIMLFKVVLTFWSVNKHWRQVKWRLFGSTFQELGLFYSVFQMGIPVPPCNFYILETKSTIILGSSYPFRYCSAVRTPSRSKKCSSFPVAFLSDSFFSMVRLNASSTKTWCVDGDWSSLRHSAASCDNLEIDKILRNESNVTNSPFYEGFPYLNWWTNVSGQILPPLRK